MVEKINYVKSEYDLQKYKVKREQYIEKLLLEDYVRTIKSYTSRYDVFELEVFKKAQNQKNEKLKADRPEFEMIKGLIVSDFLNGDKKFKLTNIMSCGMESYAWDFEFKGYDKTIYIEIPYRKKLTTDNIEYANHGMFSFLVRTGESSRDVIKRSHKMEDIAEVIKEYFGL